MTWYRQCNCPTTRAKLVLSGSATFGTPACLACDKAFSNVCNNAKANAFNREDAEEILPQREDDEEE